MNDPNDIVIDVRNLSKTYRGGGEALKDVTLRIPRGQVLGLLGKNASGKTTLLKCLVGLLRPSGGSATLLGEDAWDLSASAKSRLGYVPQTPTLPMWMRVKHLIAYTAAFYDRWNHELAETLLRRWELPENSRIATLSVGQVQRLSILLAMGHEPELLILDEPVASLDPAGRREFLAQILDLAGNGQRTILFSTHITSDVERVADTVAILRAGRLFHHRSLDELKDSVKRLHITATMDLPPSFALPGAGALKVRKEGRQAVATVQHMSPQLIADIKAQWQADVEVEDLNLEDIFLDLHDETPAMVEA
ncbi:MAG: ABC transporter ATP-binding protein [Phycisphaeraceae bacterium]|nr:ABC transporter ATP-binding protein [Phycisphaeraceae bacterium]